MSPQWLKDIIIDLYDPLALDLDGDGAISLIADKTGSVYFDHDCDGVAFRSSWVSSNDGILVFDRNGDGLINNGSELFGNFTPKNNEEFATDGFNALSDFDTNNDGIIDINDTEFSNLKIWQDINSNGISETNELKTLNELGIENLNLNATQTNLNLGNGNSQISQSIFTKTDGTTSLIADLNFNVDTINRKFVGENEINLTPEQLSRPNIKGTGFLRDLRFASALNENLANLIETYSVATTKQEQINLLDSVISSWAKTNPNYGFNFTLLKATATNGGSARVIRMTPTQHRIYQSFTPSAGLLNSFIAITDKISIINAFSGRVNQNLFYTSSNDIENIINQTNKTYEAIRDYVYKSLLTQTRLKDYLNLITLDINEVSNLTRSSNPNFEFSLNYDKVIDKFNEIHATNPQKAFIDLAEFIDLYKDKSTLGSLMTTLSEFATIAKDSGEINDYLKELNSETIKNLSTQHGSENDDTLIGTGILNGIDTLYGEGGNDILNGGNGNDYLDGGSGSDIYEFSGNFGNDIINNHDTSKNRFDIIKFTDGTTKAELKFEKSNNDLIIKKAENSINVKDFFKDDLNLSYIINAIEFKDGTRLTSEQIVDIILTPTNGNDNLEMFFANRDYTINALGGDDSIITKNGNDTIYAGSGNDSVDSGNGADIIFGESGNDNIYGGDGNDTLIGGSGDDFLQGGEGNDTYIFNGKFDNDTVLNFKPNKDEKDTIKFIDLKAKDLNFKREFDGKDFSNDLVITTKNGSVKIENFFNESSINENYKIDKIHTKDKILTPNEIKEILTKKSIYNDQIQAFEGQIQINGGFGDDILKASKSGTILNGEMGNDTLISNTSNDTLYGGYGNDKFIYQRNGGSDTISDNGGSDTLVLKGISKDEANFTQSGKDLIISFNFNNDKITIKDHFKGLLRSNKIENIIFDKDENLTISQIDEFITNKWNKITYNDISNKFNSNISESVGEFISQEKIDKIIEQINTYSDDKGLGNFAFNDIQNSQNLQLYGV